jgi:hypothetical protein
MGPFDEVSPERDEPTIGMGRVEITSEVRESHLRLLERMRRQLHFAKEGGRSAMEVIQQMWEYLMGTLSENISLRLAYGCERTLRKWFSLRMKDRATFL